MIALVLTIPDIPVALLLAILVPLMVLGPIVSYPFSKTLWVAVDRAFLQRLDPDERPDEQSGTTESACVRLGRRSTVRVSTPSSNVQVASPTIAKSWKSSCACSMNAAAPGPRPAAAAGRCTAAARSRKRASIASTSS